MIAEKTSPELRRVFFRKCIEKGLYFHSSNNQTASGTYNVSGVATGVLNASPAQTDSSAITIKFTGTNGVATVDGVKQVGMVVEVINLPGGGAVPNPYLPASLNQSTASKVVTPDAGMYSWAAGDVSVSRATSNIIQVGDGGANARWHQSIFCPNLEEPAEHLPLYQP